MSSDALRAALVYVERHGFAVVPVAIDKRPCTSHGVRDATRDPDQVRRLWSEHPSANVAIACGPVSNLIVGDIDPRNGGEDTLAELVKQYGPLPETVLVITGGGGMHYWFRPPPGREIPSAILGPGVDLQAGGKYIVAPPSVHASGRRYEFEISSRLGEAELAIWPWGIITPKRTAFSFPERVPEGNRDNTMIQAAGVMRRAGFSEEAIKAALLAENERVNIPPLPPEQIEQKARSIAKKPAGARIVGDYDTTERGAIQEERPAPQPNPLIMANGTALDLFNADLPEERAIVPGFLYPQGASQITAEGGTGKTFVALQLAAALGSETITEWIGLSVPGARDVGYLGTEGTAKRYQERVRTMVQHLGGDWLPRFHPRTPRWGGRSIWDIPGDEEIRGWVIAWIRHYKLEVLIADPFTSMKSGDLEENSGSDMSLVTAAFAEIRDATGCAMVYLHHPPYNRQGGRASTVLRNVLDAELFLEGQGEREIWQAPGGLVKVSWTKPDRFGICPKPRTLERQPNGLLLEAEGGGATATERLVVRLVTEPMLLTDLVTSMAHAEHPIGREGLRKIAERLHRRGALRYEVPQGKPAIVSPASNTSNSGVSLRLEEAISKSSTA